MTRLGDDDSDPTSDLSDSAIYTPGDMDLLYKEGFGRIAGKTRAVDLVIHPRKPAPGAINTTMDDLRGTGAQEGAIRAARILNFMTTAEASQLGISEEHRRLHVRIDGGKNNPGPIAKAHWVKIETEDLPNGDIVAVATPWNPPKPFDGVTIAQMHECRKAVQGGAFRDSVQSPDSLKPAQNKVLDIEEREDTRGKNANSSSQAHGARRPSSPMLTVV